MRTFFKIFIISLLSFILVNPFVSALKAQTNSESINLNLTIEEYVALELPDSLDMDVRVNENQTIEDEVYLKTNCQVSISIESSGFQGDENHLLNDYVVYNLAGIDGERSPSFSYGPITVEPGTDYSGILRVSWLGEKFSTDSNWQDVTTGNYQDTITVTISYNQ